MSLLTGKEVSMDMYRKFLKDMEAQGHNPKHGRMFDTWPKSTIPRWRENMGDNIVVNEVKLFSAKFRVNIIKWRPMVISINVWDQFRADREDGTLVDMVLDDMTKSGHATVLKGLTVYDSRRDQKTYSFTRAYLTNVKGLLRGSFALEFIKQ